MEDKRLFTIVTEAKDLTLVEKDLIGDILTESTILELIVNNLMMDKKVSTDIKKEILILAGEHFFTPVDKDCYIWKGV